MYHRIVMCRDSLYTYVTEVSDDRCYTSADLTTKSHVKPKNNEI